jgi:hypothetical protein
MRLADVRFRGARRHRADKPPAAKKIPRVIKRHHNHDRPRKKSIEFSRLRLAVFSFASGLFSKICRLVFLRIACFGS